MPLQLRVCGRDTGTTKVDGAACNGLEDGDVDESAGDEEPGTVASDSVGEEGRPPAKPAEQTKQLATPASQTGPMASSA